MWQTNTLWFEVAIVSIVLLLGHISFGHFEERSPKRRKLLKAIAAYIIVISISIAFGRTVAFTVLGLWLIPVLYIHGILLPKNGINGWTGKPKSKYYEFRGWSKDIFKEEDTPSV
jgi:hypothetical protein